MFRWQLCLLYCICLFFPLSVQASTKVDGLSVAQITFDDEGRPLDYPAAVFFDHVREELYIANGGTGRVTVYGQDYFPRWSIGSGRDVLTPLGGTVLPDGRVFIVQIKNRVNPTPRITELNGAFLPVQNFPLDNFPGAKDFIPRNVAINAGGLMYVSGDMYRGVLVLDEEGYFLRKLQPKDELSVRRIISEPEEKAAGEEEPETAVDAVGSDEYANIPEEYRPSKSRGVRTANTEAASDSSVQINYVTIDSQGLIYLVSPETGKIYVYDSEERFLFLFGTKGGSPGQLSNPRALVIDEERDLIFIADYMRHTILTYNMSGEYLFEVGGRGSAPGWFNFPNDIALNSRGELIVADLFNRRVQVLDVDYESRFLSLEDLLKVDPETDDAEQELQPAEDGNEVEVETFDLVPGAPDIDYEAVGEELTPAVDGEPAEETDSAETVEIEILQEQEIPAISR